MTMENVLALFGGLALFLYGMQMMSDGLEAAAGNKMKQILEKLTSNRLIGVVTGAVITAVIQSSSATTVMVVGFVNSGMMTLQQAVWIIMGANIGTTITGQLIALDVGAMAPAFAFLGVASIVFIKNEKLHHYGSIVAGLGVLFIGMDMMGAAMVPLRDSEAFISMMTNCSNPVVGILVGAGFTALIQSSSASVGILQALATNGLVSFSSAVFILFGQNIGTCITAVLAAIGTSRSAKRTTVIHLMFNIIGTIIFTTICILTPFEDFVASWTPGNPAAQIANMHTTFNVCTSLLLIPFGTYLALAAEKILPDSKEEQAASAHIFSEEIFRNPKQLGFSAIHMAQLGQEIERMLGIAKENVDRCFQAVIDKSIATMKETDEYEEQIDMMNKEIGKYISKVLAHDITGNDIKAIEEYFLITGNIERIGDHAVNIAGYVDMMEKKNVIFSEGAQEEIKKMQEVCGHAMELLVDRHPESTSWLAKVAGLEQQIDDMTVRYRERHMKRMRDGLCTEEGCILFSELLTDFERIGDHALNIAQSYAKISNAQSI